MKLEGEYKKRAVKHVEVKQKPPPEVRFPLSEIRRAEDWLKEAGPELLPKNQAPRPARKEIRARLDRASAARRAKSYDRHATKNPEIPPPDLRVALEFLASEYPELFSSVRNQREINLTAAKDKLDLLPPDIQRAVRQMDTYLTCRGEESLKTQELKAARGPRVREYEHQVSAHAQEYYTAEGVLTSSFLEGQAPEYAEARKEIGQLEKTCQDIADRLVASAGVSGHLKLKIIIRDDDSINAHVLTAGKERLLEQLVNDPPPDEPIELLVYINFGLLKSWVENGSRAQAYLTDKEEHKLRRERNSPDALAAVLAHELSHLLQPNAFAEYAEASDQQRLEYDADLNGMRLLDRAGFNPQAMVRVLENLGGNNWQHLWQAAGASHPPTEERRKVLLKEFNRADTVYANAPKPYQTFSPDDIRAVAIINTIKEQQIQKNNQELQTLSTCWNGLDQVTGKKPGLARYRDTEIRFKNLVANIPVVETAIDTYTRHVVIAKELAADERGLRSRALLCLSAIQEALKKFPEDKLAISLHTSDYNPQYEPELLKQPFAEDANSIENQKTITDNYLRTLEKTTARILPPEQYQNLDYWLSDNPETQPVWDYITENKHWSPPLNAPEERRNFIGSMLAHNLRYSGLLKIELRVTRERKERRLKKSDPALPTSAEEVTPSPASSTLSRLLESAPLAGTRLHRQQQTAEPPPKQEYEEVTVKYEDTEPWFEVDSSRQEYHIDWLKKEDQSELPLTKEIRATVHEQTRVALRRELSDRGLFVSDKTLVFLTNVSIASAGGAYRPNENDITNLNRLAPDDLDWTELATVRLALDTFNFGSSLLPKKTYENQSYAPQANIFYDEVWANITYLLTTVWRPRIQAEIELQNSLIQKARTHRGYENKAGRITHITLGNQDPRLRELEPDSWATKEDRASLPVTSVQLKQQAFFTLLARRQNKQPALEKNDLADQIPTGPLLDRLRDQWLLAQDLTRKHVRGLGLVQLLQHFTPEEILPRIIQAIQQAQNLRDQTLEYAMTETEATPSVHCHYWQQQRDFSEKNPHIYEGKTARNLLDPLLGQVVADFAAQLKSRGLVLGPFSRETLINDLGFLAYTYDAPDHTWQTIRLAQTLPFSPEVKKSWLGNLAKDDKKKERQNEHEALVLPHWLEKLEYATPKEWAVFFAREEQPHMRNDFKNILYTEALGRLLGANAETPELQQAKKKIVEILAALEPTKYLEPADFAMVWGQLPPYTILTSNIESVGSYYNPQKHEWQRDPVQSRQLFELYKALGVWHAERWQELPAFKRFDEWLSHIEWKNFNPLFAVEPQLEKLIDGLSQKSSGADTYSILTLDSYLGEAYQFDTSDFSSQKFSWALLLRDFLDPARHRDRIIADILKLAEKRENNIKPEEKKQDLEKLTALLRGLYATLHDLINRPDLGPILASMHNGLFKEALLAGWLAKRQLPLEQLQDYGPKFERPYHESVVANKTEIFIQLQTQDILTKNGEEIFNDILKQYDITTPHSVSYTHNYLRITALKFQEPDWYVRQRILDKKASAQDLAEIAAYEAALEKIHDIQSEYAIRMQARYEQCLADQPTRTPENQVKLFSDLVAEDGKTTLQAEPAHWYRLILADLTQSQGRFLAEQNLVAAEAQIKKLLPEASPLKDLFLENVLIHKVAELLGSPERPVTPERIDVDLTSLFPHDQAMAKKMFWQKYPVYEILNLTAELDRANAGARWRIMRTVRLALPDLSPVGQQKYGRLLTTLESETLWPALQRGAQKNPELFSRYLSIIKQRYSEASFERDQILEKIGLELAETPKQIREIWALRYEQVTRWPDQNETAKEKKKYESFERLKSYLSLQEPARKSEIMLWFLGGKMPPAEAFASQHFKVDAGSRVDNFWHLTTAERRHIFYSVLLGDKGLVEPAHKNVYDDFITGLYKQNMADLRVNPNLPLENPENQRGQKVLQTVFIQLLQSYQTPARRAELLITVSETLARERDKPAESAGGMIKVLLEQLGVIGIKIGQVLSEQPGLLPPALQQDLSYLKDRAAPFNKYGVLNYLEAGGNAHETIDRIQECVGSASIKQVHRAATADGREVALKVKRPSIDKNFEEDVAVLRSIIEGLQWANINVPPHLLSEVEKSARAELDFVAEANQQKMLGETLRARNAKLELNFISTQEEWPITTSEVHYPTQAGQETGLMIEDYIKGLSLKNLKEYQVALSQNEAISLKNWRERAGNLYGQVAAADIEKKISRLDLDKLQAAIAMDLLTQITSDGSFHADPHAGNIYFDFTPGQERTVYIDLGSVGHSYKEGDFDYRQDFADFITLFSGNSGPTPKAIELLEKFTALPWGEEEVRELLAETADTESRAKKIFYGILKRVTAAQGKLDNEFRYLLKTLATGAEHFDKLKQQINA